MGVPEGLVAHPRSVDALLHAPAHIAIGNRRVQYFERPLVSNTMNSPPLLDIENATIFRGTTRVFDGLTLRVEQHQQVAVIGPNGAGKTTLLKLLNREIYPVAQTNSRVQVLGRSDWNVWALREHLGVVSDDLHMRYRRTTTGLNVVVSGFFSSIGTHGQLARKVTGSKRSRALETMRELGIGDLADVSLERMSTGQQRRCLLARALVHEPSTLILDEPTSGLDLAASFEYLERIRHLIERGHSIVLVTHHLNEIPLEIDRVILLNTGKIVADGPKHEVLTEENLEATYGVPLRVAVVDGHYLAYPRPPSARA